MTIISAASKLVFTAVFSIFICLVDWPEFMSIDTNASVGFMTKYPPDLSLQLVQKYYLTLFQYLHHEKGILPRYFFIF